MAKANTTTTAVSTDRTVDLAVAKECVLRAINANKVIYLEGGSGIGKSELIAQVATELGGAMIDVRLATMSVTDIRGMPYYSKEDNLMKWAAPIDLPSAQLCSQYPVVVLFLDEFNCAPPSVMAATYQLTLNRRVGEYVLPDNVRIVMAGNAISDGGVTFKMPAPVLNRITKVKVRPDADVWLNSYAIPNQLHPAVVGWINYNKAALHDYDPKLINTTFPSPRAWKSTSDYLYASSNSYNDPVLNELIVGTINEGHALKFFAHMKIAGMLPDPKAVLDGSVTKMDCKEISAMYSLITSVCYEMKSIAKTAKLADVNRMFDTFLRFSMDNFPAEVIIVGARMAIMKYDIMFEISKLNHWEEFHVKYGKYFSNSGN